MNWQTYQPLDIDLHVMAINKTDSIMCRIWYENKFGCPSASQDRDNANGGPNGAEIVTLTDVNINCQFTYLVAIEDYEFENGGEHFVNSGAAIAVRNELHSIGQPMEAISVLKEKPYYFFGCVDVHANGNFTFTSAPNGIFFDGEDDAKWTEMMMTFC